jgi:low temperature requirement protein LtrA
MRSVLRDHEAGEGAVAVTSVELFFDLVYVFAVTQLSHTLLHHLDVRGAVQTLVLFLAVWWAWNYTAWATNWIDPDQPPVRALMVLLMLLSLVMSAAIPRAFDGQGDAFAISYVAIQLLRSAFMVLAFRGQRMGRNYAQLLAWSAMASVLWLAGAAAHGDGRLVLWGTAVLVDYLAPWVGFALPGMGRTPMSAWTLAGAHLAERCRLVLLIAFGESVLAAGATYSELPHTVAVLAAFVVGFLGVVALWALYFVRGAEEASQRIARVRDSARLGRTGYAYAHAVMVAGVIVVAVAIDLVTTAPRGTLAGATAAVILAGPAIYLAGHALFSFTLSGELPTTRLLGILALAALSPLALAASPLALEAAAVLAVALVLLAGGAPVSAPEPSPDR